MDVKFYTTTSNKLPSLAVTNGQLIFLEDKDAAYYDMGNTRRPVSGVKVVSSLPSSANAQSDVIYVVINSTTGFADASIWNASSSTFVPLSGYLATTANAGNVKPDGSTITVDENGTITATEAAVPIATTAVLGKVKPNGDTIKVSSGTISTDECIYVTCSTGASTTVKTASYTGYTLKVGRLICVQFSSGNTTTSPTLNINSTGAIGIRRSNNTGDGLWFDANERVLLTYSGSYYEVVGVASSNTNYGTCSTAASTTAKTVTLPSYKLLKGSFIAVNFTYDVPAGATLNVNSRGAKNIRYKGSNITAGVISAGETVLFCFDGTYYQFISSNKNYSCGLATTATAGLVKPDGTTVSVDSNGVISVPSVTDLQSRVAALELLAQTVLITE